MKFSTLIINFLHFLFFICLSCGRESIDYPINIELTAKEDSVGYKALLLEFPNESRSNAILFDDTSGLIVHVGSNGEFKNIIARRGLKTGDFFSFIASVVDMSVGRVYVLDLGFVHKYSLEGNYMGSFKVLDIDKPQLGIVDGLSLLEDGEKLLLHVNNHFGYADYDYILIDTLGKILTTHNNSYKFFRKQIIPELVNNYTSYHYDGMLLVKDNGDTLFSVTNNTMVPRYVFSSVFELTTDIFDRESTYDSKPIFTQIFENDNILMFKAQNRDKYFIGKFFKHKKKGLLYSYSIARNIVNADTDMQSDIILKDYSETKFFSFNGVEYNLSKIRDELYIGNEMVSFDFWNAVVGKHHSSYSGTGYLPATRVCWRDAWAFSRILTDKSGTLLRLPTEYELFVAGKMINRDSTYYELCLDSYESDGSQKAPHYLGNYNGLYVKAINYSKKIPLLRKQTNSVTGFRLVMEL